jgi:hypothetical protein
MNKPQLIAETPRAGKWNSRFLAAQDGSLSDSEVAKIVTAARRNPRGDDYLAVSADRAQLLSGRTGKEILVLVGVDVKKLSETERLQKIVDQLDQRLDDLATLVTEGIDWDRDGQAILVKRRELGEWEKGFDGLPTVLPRREKKAAEPKKPSSGRLIVEILLVLGLGIWAITQHYEEEPAPPTILPKKTTKNPTQTGETPLSTSDAEHEKKKLQEAQKECVKTFKDEIETFLNQKGYSSTTCSLENTPTITSETTLKNFLTTWCHLELETDYKYKKVDKYSLSIPNTDKELTISKEEFKQLEQNFDNFKKCKNPS